MTDGYGDFARFYDELQAACGVDYSGIARYYDALLCLHRDISDFAGEKGILLDLACGTGSLTGLMSELGYDAVGVDSSPEMLTFAEQKKTPDSNIRYLCQDMRKLDLYGTVDCCVSALDSLNHLSDAGEILQVFDKVSLFMNPGGVFVFDMNTLKKHNETLANNAFIFDSERVFCAWQNFLTAPGEVTIELHLFEKKPGGVYRRCYETFGERAYAVEQILRMLTATGFEPVGCYDWLTFSPGGEHSEKVVFAARKI